MPQFFFDFRQGEDHCIDPQGLELGDAEEAYLQAFRAAREMWTELMAERQDPRRCTFEVRGAERELLFILPFQEVLDVCLNRAPPALHSSFRSAAHNAIRAKRATEEFSAELRSIRETLQEARSLLLLAKNL